MFVQDILALLRCFCELEGSEKDERRLDIAKFQGYCFIASGSDCYDVRACMYT